MRSARNILLFVASWIAVGAALHQGLPPPPVADPILAEKLKHFAAHRDEYDTLFFGSSLVYRGIDPAVFDAQMAAAGDPTRSFNFGIGGMQQHETDALIQDVLALKPRRLRYVFIELARWRTDIDPENFFKDRVVGWHTWRETSSVLRSIWLRADNPLVALRDSADHVVHMAARYTRVGQGPRLLRNWAGIPRFSRPSRDPDLAVVVSQQGYAGFDATRDYADQPEHKMHRDILVAGRDTTYKASVEKLIAENRAAVDVDALLARYNLAAVRRQVAQWRALGVEPAFVVLPHQTSMPELARLRELGETPVLLLYNDPEKHADLYEFEMRFDFNHLVDEGAKRLTRRVAEDFLAARNATDRAP